MQKFVTELLVGSSPVQVLVEEIAERAQGLPLLAYLLVEEAKRCPDDRGWLENLPITIPRFLELSYKRLDLLSRKLLRRTAVLRYDDAVDVGAAAALLECDETEALAPLEAVQVLFGGSRTHVDRAVRDFASERLLDEEPENIERLRGVIRRWRADRFGLVPPSRITRDFWTTNDLLGYRAFADAVTAFIRHPDTHPPLTIGIKGPWGAGKTSLMRMIREQLDPADDLGQQGRIELTRDSRQHLGSRWKRDPEPDDRLTMRELLSQTSRIPEFSADPTPDQAPLRAQVADGTLHVAEWRPTVWFNPWMYQSDEQVWAGLAGEIINQVASRLALGDRERFWLRLNLGRLDREAVRQNIYRLLLTRLLPPLLGVVLLAAAAVPVVGLHLLGVSPFVLYSGSLLFALASAVQIVRFMRESASGAFGRLLRGPTVRGISKDVAETVAGALRDPGYQARAGFLHLVQADIRRVIKLVATPHRPLVVFVDDLDRCSPSTVTQVIEAISLFLAGEFPDCLFLVAMEPDLLAAHVEVAYKDLAVALRERQGNPDWTTLGWRFLDKIVQLPLSLPAIDMNRYLNSYIRSLLDIPDDVAQDLGFPNPRHSAANGARSSDGGQAPPGVGQVVHSRATEGRAPETAGEAQVFGSNPPQTLDTALLERFEHELRLRRPSLEDLARIAAAVQSDLLGEPGFPLLEEAIAAADRVFDDLYSDAQAWTAIKATLPGFGVLNPREIKRYLNLFRFYTFITQRRQLVEGIAAPSGGQIARLAALVIRWPHLLTALGAGQQDNTALHRLETAARQNSKEWLSELTNVGLGHSDHEELRVFLRTGEEIAQAASLLI